VGELLLVRHGETEWTLSRRHTSYTDLPLTANGEDQARAVAGMLAQHSIALALTSPRRRATRTAELAGLRNAQVEPDLREWDYGGYEGLTTPEIRRRRPGWVLWTDGVAAGPGDHPGEGPVQVGLRADRVLARTGRVLRDSPLGAVVLVAHGHFLRVLAARWLGLAPAAGAMFRLGTGTVSALGTEHGRPVISTWNATPPTGSRVQAAAADARRAELPAVLALGARSGDGGDLRLPACDQSPAMRRRGRVTAGPRRIWRHSAEKTP
jgi:broad specificity phosphatase PhoE